MPTNRVFSVALGALVVVAMVRVCAAEPASESPGSGNQFGQAIPASQLSQVRGAGIETVLPGAPAAMIRLWDELRGRRGPPPSGPNYSMGTLTITVGPAGQR
jgi:hypothetical protein